MFIKQRQFQER